MPYNKSLRCVWYIYVAFFFYSLKTLPFRLFIQRFVIPSESMRIPTDFLQQHYLSDINMEIVSHLNSNFHSLLVKLRHKETNTQQHTSDSLHLG